MDGNRHEAENDYHPSSATSGTPPTPETARLARVYQKYHDDPAVQQKWEHHNAGNQAILREREQKMQQVLQRCGRWPLNDQVILEVGCGSGNVLAGLQTWGAQVSNLHGVDLLPERIAAAQQQHPALHFQCANAEQLDFDDDSFHLILVFTVFSSILDDDMACNVAQEISRILAPHGAILWYDFRYDNPRNPHVRGITAAGIQQRFPGFRSHLRTLTLLPPLARRLGPLTPRLYPVLAAVPALRTHYLGLLWPD